MLARLALAGALALASLSAASAFDDGQWQNIDPKTRDWFKSIRSPEGIPCCDISDGHRTSWRGDPKTGQYEVLIEGEWVLVPPRAIVHTHNPVGEAVVWYIKQGTPTKWLIRCFVPGDGA